MKMKEEATPEKSWTSNIPQMMYSIPIMNQPLPTTFRESVASTIKN
jgi:hypothetical protein